MAVNSGVITRAFQSSSGERILKAIRSVASADRGVTTRGDVSATLAAGDEQIQVWNTPITANRTVTLPTGTEGGYFRIVRTAAATGAFTLIAAGVTVPIAGFADFHHDGTAWVNTAKGSLA